MNTNIEDFGVSRLTLKESQDILACDHDGAGGGNDYILCMKCGLEYDYRKETEASVIGRIRQHVQALLDEPVGEVGATIEVMRSHAEDLEKERRFSESGAIKLLLMHYDNLLAKYNSLRLQRIDDADLIDRLNHEVKALTLEVEQLKASLPNLFDYDPNRRYRQAQLSGEGSGEGK